MGRSKNDSGPEILLEFLELIFRYVNPWLSVPLAVIGFFVIAALWNAFFKSIPQLQVVGLVIGAGFVILCLFAGLRGAEFRRNQRAFLAADIDLQWVRGLSWRGFERQLAEVYRQQGYMVEESGGGGPDGGVDLRMNRDGLKTIVQCKHWKTWKVGVRPVRELFGIMTAEGADAAIFVTSGTYTQEALRFAQGKPIKLIGESGFLDLVRQFQKGLQTHYGVETTASQLKALSVSSADVPCCPLCRSPMKLRTAKRGPNAGSQFWGCSRFPACSGTRNLA